MNTRHPMFSAAEPVNVPLSADDVLSQALSVIRGRVFGKRATEIAILKEALRANGFEIVKKDLFHEGALRTERPDSVNHGRDS